MSKKELSMLLVDGKYGGNQYKFKHPIMNRGGCSTVCACQAAALLALKDESKKSLYIYDSLELSQKEFTKFADIMYKFVAPGFRGLADINIFAQGFKKYAQSKGVDVNIDLLPGDADFEQAEEFIKTFIDKGISIQYLLLHHENPIFEEIEWHWFTVTGYDEENIIYSTWGERRKANLQELWQTKEKLKGGLVAIY